MIAIGPLEYFYLSGLCIFIWWNICADYMSLQLKLGKDSFFLIWKNKGLFCLTAPLKHIDFHSIGYASSSIGHFYIFVLRKPTNTTYAMLSNKQWGTVIWTVPHTGDHTLSLWWTSLDHWLERKIAQTTNTSAMQDRSTMQPDPNFYSWMFYHLSYELVYGILVRLLIVLLWCVRFC